MAVRADNPRYRVWVLTNGERAKAGRAALKYSDCLEIKYAQPWAAYMARTGDFRHQSLLQGRCAKDLTGENIAAGYLTPEAVMSAWMNSPGHKENILRPQFSIMGVGVADSTDAYRKYWVQNFG
ncbi:CAP domain-containing protein [Nakamurella sp. DB0629]|uniref:CAP domain-containing protein n=2 Tax=Nakamurella aerolata TaxID=1656892 RepID=A0A849A693_9ACTN|nr:CAP domain-containing protein [Nakamurella aerolata]